MIHYFFLILVCEAFGTAATPGLLCQPRVIVKMFVEKQMECSFMNTLFKENIGNSTYRDQFGRLYVYVMERNILMLCDPVIVYLSVKCASPGWMMGFGSQ
jgi:hypothetical protein